VKLREKVSYWNSRVSLRCSPGLREGRENDLEKNGKALKQLKGGGVTVNQKTVSRRSFSQLIHTVAEHNFSAIFWLPHPSKFRAKKRIGENP
jgi:hypothetical protein